jgi:hypothetical protein
VLAGVTALAPSNVWAVGFYAKDVNTDRPTKTFIEHRDGSSWKVVSSPTSDFTPRANPTTSGVLPQSQPTKLGLR